MDEEITKNHSLVQRTMLRAAAPNEETDSIEKPKMKRTTQCAERNCRGGSATRKERSPKQQEVFQRMLELNKARRAKVKAEKQKIQKNAEEKDRQMLEDHLEVKEATRKALKPKKKIKVVVSDSETESESSDSEVEIEVVRKPRTTSKSKSKPVAVPTEGKAKEITIQDILTWL